jgi:hypothetical protein
MSVKNKYTGVQKSDVYAEKVLMLVSYYFI